MEKINNLKSAQQLISQEKYADAYDKCAGIIHEDIMTEVEYIKLSKELWKKLRYGDAEVTLEASIHKFPWSTQSKDLYDKIRADRVSLFSFKNEKLSDIAFHLDSTSKGFFKKEIIHNIEIRGWVAFTQKNCSLLVDQEGSDTTKYSISIPRKDVVLHFSKKGLPEPIERCGFSFTADLSKPLTISLQTLQGTIPFVRIKKEKVLQVLEGRSGWLFLDNDTNRAADIFTGKIPATKKIVDSWSNFSTQVKKELDTRNIKSCFVISPSKEDVFPEYHPLKAASLSLIDIISSAIFINGSTVSCPVRKLRQQPESYYKTDTHWSYLGAWICTLDILELLKIPKPNTSVSFLDAEAFGDLGSKMVPPQKSIQKLWDPKNNVAELIFNNKIRGTGNVKIYENAKHSVDESVLIFGGSSSSHLAVIMSNIFSRTVAVNSPSTMPIFEIIDKEMPNIVIIQTNARYLVNSPKIVNKIDESPFGKNPSWSSPKHWLS